MFVATAPTVYGIETIMIQFLDKSNSTSLQQHLPFTVLKLCFKIIRNYNAVSNVATAPTVYGIETTKHKRLFSFNLW